MKKPVIYFLVTSMLLVGINTINVKAEDFAQNEDKYYELCSSTSLTSSQVNTCRDFSTYLTNKNKDLKDSIDETENLIDDAKKDLASITSTIESIDTQIAEKEKEIDYLVSSIKNLEISIKDNEDTIKERMYAMQSYINNDSYVQFIFGAESFSDMFSRLYTINELTDYDSELIRDLQLDKEQIVVQQKQMESSKANLVKQKQKQVALQAEFDRIFNQQLAALEAQQNSSAEITENQKVVENAISKSFDKLNQPTTGGGSSGGGSVTPGLSETGNAIAQKALTKLDCRYWWGAPGGGYGDGQGLDNPNAIYFDCSGFVAWTHRQSGVMIPRTTASGYSRMGTGISRSQLQAGDVVTFNGGYGTVFHIGIYIGNGNVIHASGYGSGTLGQKPNERVKIHSLDFLDATLGVYNYRRLY